MKQGTIWLLMIYTKSMFENLPLSILKELKNEIEEKDS